MSLEETQTYATTELREYLAILRVRKWTVILTTALVLAGALTYSYWQIPVYSASSRVVINPPTSDGSVLVAPQLVDVETESEILASEPVAELVREELGLQDSVFTLLGPLDVENVTESRVLEVSYTSTDPERARDLANGFVTGYIEYRRTQALEAIASQQLAAQAQVDEAAQELEELNQQIEEADESGNNALVQSLETSRNVLLARLGVLEQELNNLQPDASALGGGEIIESAQLPSSPSSPDHLLNGILALVLGVPLGIALAFVRERLDNRFRGRDDVERALMAPVLATVPRFKTPKAKGAPIADAIVASNPQALASEAYRSLRTNVRFLTAQRGIGSLLVTSPALGEGKTITTANLGIALAQAGMRVILVSADLRRPSLEKYFDLPAAEGLSDWLIAGDDNLWRFVKDPGIPNLRLVPSGPVPPNPAELLTSARLVFLLERLEENSDLVLVDSPPAFPVADPAILAARVKGTIMVVDAAATHRSAAVRAKEEIERAGGTIIGIVLNAFDPTSSPYYYQSPYYPYYARQAGDLQSATGNGGRAGRHSRRSRFSFRR